MPPDETLDKVETRCDSSLHTVLNCFQCIAHVFESKAAQMTLDYVETR